MGSSAGRGAGQRHQWRRALRDYHHEIDPPAAASAPPEPPSALFALGAAASRGLILGSAEPRRYFSLGLAPLIEVIKRGNFAPFRYGSGGCLTGLTLIIYTLAITRCDACAVSSKFRKTSRSLARCARKDVGQLFLHWSYLTTSHLRGVSISIVGWGVGLGARAPAVVSR